VDDEHAQIANGERAFVAAGCRDRLRANGPAGRRDTRGRIRGEGYLAILQLEHAHACRRLRRQMDIAPAGASHDVRAGLQPEQSRHREPAVVRLQLRFTRRTVFQDLGAIRVSRRRDDERAQDD
jgi:hypothetical protein